MDTGLADRDTNSDVTRTSLVHPTTDMTVADIYSHTLTAQHWESADLRSASR